MADKKMVESIVLSKEFLEMPVSARYLYLTLDKIANDDFVSDPEAVMKTIGAGMEDLNILAEKKLIILFPDGAFIVSHWRIRNYITDNVMSVTSSIEDIKPAKEKKSSGSRAVFTPPTIEEVREYCNERRNGVDPESWYNHYAAKGWMIGKTKMKDWKAAVRTWEKPRTNQKSGSVQEEVNGWLDRRKGAGT